MGVRARSRCRRVSFMKTLGVRSVPAFRRVKACNESGLTLLEVVIAMAILSVAVIGLVGGLSFVISVSDTLEEQAVTETLGARYVEEHLNGDCLSEESSLGTYQVDGHVVGEEYNVRVTSDGEELFELSSLAGEVTNCSESVDE
ncbi:MAG: prepilin-type N-terminal cleavage/methylation domain-containing protein [Dehalococcoidia bacterium]|nr:prepilin-type N-terminal cleavage/methylation domain-containing protein [Dehalococcoidia bacterium]